MRNWLAVAVCAFALGCGGCRRGDEPHGSAAREVGREAYQFSQQSKRAATKVGRELKQAGKEMSEGWKEARREDRTRRPSNRPRE